MTSPPYDGLREVYPRVCGGTHLSCWRCCPGQGLSPRVRGNRGISAAIWTRGRSIPACAGEPSLRMSSPPLFPVYPRVCGGTVKQQRSPRRLSGLSPRVRGNPVNSLAHAAGVGSIPACAGEPGALCASFRNARVYPRVCGGTPGDYLCRIHRQGLSPRVRGNPAAGEADLAFCGSIPACAGEPRKTAAGVDVGRVYPRVCGGTLYRFSST